MASIWPRKSIREKIEHGTEVSQDTSLLPGIRLQASAPLGLSLQNWIATGLPSFSPTTSHVTHKSLESRPLSYNSICFAGDRVGGISLRIV